ncbi:beta strand repeat-containing protein [Undibacterium sp. TJN19]|uniref:beta strand repeat-containing protein n=1 Tax=Undibacterium sp. TJN19 TaxID=3413055 RepID=UPI003BF1BF50
MKAKKYAMLLIAAVAATVAIAGAIVTLGGSNSGLNANAAGGGASSATGPRGLMSALATPGSNSILNVSVAGDGTVSSTAGSPGAVTCTSAVVGYTGNCSQLFDTNSTFTLHASGSGFTGWAGPGLTAVGTGCSGTADCTFTKTADTQYVTAIFASGGTNDAGSNAPQQLYTDITSGPTSGGENNKGIYLSVFGQNFGTTGAGTSAKVYLDNIEVDNYRSIGTSRGRADIQQITAQIGALGGASNGTSLPVKVVINGNVATDANQLSFKVNPGKIYFVSLDGSDSTGQPDDINHPYRHVQLAISNNSNDIHVGCTIAGGLQPVATAGVWGIVLPGDFIIMRGGVWTDVHQANDNYFLRVQNKSGTPATGAVQTGPITLMGFPTETPLLSQALTSSADNGSGGVITSADSARQEIGCGAGITITNLKIESGRADGMIDVQAGYELNAYKGANWRVVNTELTAYTAAYNVMAKGAGVTGSGNGVVVLGNHVHDVYCGPDNGTSFLQNHGIYFDGTGSYEVAYNEIGNIFGGNGVQSYSSSGTPIGNINVHHNLIHDVRKHGINLADGTAGNVKIWNNIVYNIQYAAVRFNTTDINAAKIYNNTFYNTNTAGNNNYGALTNDWNLPKGAMDVENNIFYVATGTPYNSGSNGVQASAGTFARNLWFNGSGSPGLDSTAVLANPLFVKAGADFHLQNNSAARGAGSTAAAVTSLVTTDYDLKARSTTTMDIGAYLSGSASDSGLPAITVSPAIQGTAQVGSTLTVSTGTWTNSPNSYQYQLIVNGVDVTGSTGNSFTPGSADAGKMIVWRVTASNAKGSASVMSNTVTVAGAASPVNGTCGSANGLSFSTAPSSGLCSAGTASTLTGSGPWAWSCAGSNGGSTASCSANLASAQAPANTATPSISGIAGVGSTLTCSPGSWSNSPTSYAYQWKRADAAIAGATAASYAVAATDAGQSLTCAVTAKNAAGSATATSAAVTATGATQITPPQVVQTANPVYADGSTRPVKISFPNPVKAGNLILVSMASTQGHTYNFTVSDNKNTGNYTWYKTDACQTTCAGWFYLVAPKGGSYFTITASGGAAQAVVMSAMEVSNFDASIFDGNPVTSNGTGDTASATKLTASANSLVLTVYGGDPDQSIAPANAAGAFNAPYAHALTYGTQMAVATTPGSTPVSWSVAQVRGWTGWSEMVIAIKGAHSAVQTPASAAVVQTTVPAYADGVTRPASISFANPVKAGNLILVAMATNQGNTYNFTVSDNKNAGNYTWYKTDACRSSCAGWFYMVATTGGSSFTINANGGAAQGVVMAAYEISDFAPTIFDGNPVTASNTSASASAAKSTLLANSLVFGVYGGDFAQSIVPSYGLGALSYANPNTLTFGTQHAPATALGSSSMAWSVAQPNGWLGWAVTAIAIRSATSP